MSGWPDSLRKLGVSLFADGGYSDSVLRTPDGFKEGSLARLELCNHRSVVETALGLVANFRYSSERFKGTAVRHAMVLIICYELTQWKLMRSLLRPHLLPASFVTALQALSSTALLMTPGQFQGALSKALDDVVQAQEAHEGPLRPGCSSRRLIFS